MNLLYPLIWLIKKSRILSAVSMRLVKLTGKSRYTIHPKHLINIESPWYLSRIKSSDTVLDLGCNNGQQTLKIAGKCKKIIGLDFDQKQLVIARALAQDKKIRNARFKFQDLEKKLNFKPNSFDKIIFLDVLEHIVKRRQILKEIKRVLRPNGLVFLAVPNIETSWKKLQALVGLNYYADPDHKVEYTETEIRQVLNQAGYAINSLKPVTYDTPWVGLIDLLGGISLRLYAFIAKIKKSLVRDNLKESTGFRIIMGKKP